MKLTLQFQKMYWRTWNLTKNQLLGWRMLVRLCLSCSLKQPFSHWFTEIGFRRPQIPRENSTIGLGNIHEPSLFPSFTGMELCRTQTLRSNQSLDWRTLMRLSLLYFLEHISLVDQSDAMLAGTLCHWFTSIKFFRTRKFNCSNCNALAYHVFWNFLQLIFWESVLDNAIFM